MRLRTVVRGYQPTKTDFLFERRLNDHIASVLSEFSSGKPTLVFCSSRKGASDTALHLARGSGGGGHASYVRNAQQAARLAAVAAGLRGNAALRECVLVGVGFHHAAMEPAERGAVEQAFVAQVGGQRCASG